MTITVPASETARTASSEYDAIGMLGFMPEPGFEKMGFAKSVKKGLADTWDKVRLLVATLTSRSIAQNVGGPVMIAKVTQSSVALGPYWVLATLGGLSLSLAVINLIPIPVVDGGHLALLAVEAVRKKRLTTRTDGDVPVGRSGDSGRSFRGDYL